MEGGINTDPYSKIVLKNGSLVVSVPACGSSDPSSSLARCTIFGSTSVNHETFRDIRSACREGGIGAAVGESRTIPRYVSCCQSRTFPMYIAFWQLHSHLYLENSRVLWDSVLFSWLGGSFKQFEQSWAPASSIALISQKLGNHHGRPCGRLPAVSNGWQLLFSWLGGS